MRAKSNYARFEHSQVMYEHVQEIGIIINCIKVRNNTLI